MFNNIPKLIIFLIFLSVYGHSQEIWHESFSVPEKGVWGGNGVSDIQKDFEGISTWTLNYSGITLVDSEDYAKTVATSGGRFECRGLNGEVVWYSEEIDISDYKNVRVQLIAQETGSGANEDKKFLAAFYTLDNNSEILFETNGHNLGDWGLDTASQSGINGNKLQIVVYMRNFYSSDKVILDEVVVNGEEKNPVVIEPNDVLISEVLFNPLPEGADYVEIYNNSAKEISLNRLYLASRDDDLELTQVYLLSTLKKKFMPQDYLVLTKDTNEVFPWFTIKCKECFLQMPKFPSFNNDEDYVVLLNENLKVIDELHYTDKLHSPLLADEEGISLERISFSKETNNQENWHSASSTSGYGTPGYKNSQFEIEDVAKSLVTFSPESFSPNSDGYNDEFKIHYELEKAGYIANAWIFDSMGRLVLKLAQNEILGTNGDMIWTGEDETGQRQNLGAYIVLLEIFDTTGKVHRFKNGVVLTGIME
ncbi:MAG: lamin tail domain-containing protein [Draconibacterium sp.]